MQSAQLLTRFVRADTEFSKRKRTERNTVSRRQKRLNRSLLVNREIVVKIRECPRFQLGSPRLLER